MNEHLHPETISLQRPFSHDQKWYSHKEFYASLAYLRTLEEGIIPSQSIDATGNVLIIVVYSLSVYVPIKTS